MKIKKSVFEEIIKTEISVKEIGGLLGADFYGNIVRTVIDKGIDDRSKYVYYPNIMLFNRVIIEWADLNIRFGGIFHTHYAHDAFLSDEDIKYIERLFDEVKNEIEVLYFPILLVPSKQLIPFKVIKGSNETCLIERDTLIIFD